METNKVSPTQKDSILKSLAIAGLFAVLLLVAWLAIQLVHIFPGAFNSVASLAESVGENQESIIDLNQEVADISLSSNTSLINNGEAVVITWDSINTPGSYVFSYTCIDGVAITHQTPDGERLYNCDTNYDVGDSNNLTLIMDSEKNRYADVSYTIDFLRTNGTRPRASGSNTVTVVNTAINSQFPENTVASDENTSEVTEELAPVVTPESEQTTPIPQPTPTTPTYTQEFVYEIPASDPNGYTDLGAGYVAVGSVDNNSFTPGTVSTNESGAIQFAVKNFGTKTSQTWDFAIELPNDTTYQSPTQAPLKPNERAVLTIGFPTDSSALHTFELTLDESSDTNSFNDSFTQTVGFAQ